MKRSLIIAILMSSAVPCGEALAQAASVDDVVARAKAAFDKADQDKDGALNLQEWKAMGRRGRGFQMVDANHDGKLTPEEIRSVIAAYRSRKDELSLRSFVSGKGPGVRLLNSHA